MIARDQIYPITIIKSRYGGVYEGGEWAAFNTYSVPDGADADDVTCSAFFSNPDNEPIGRGATVQEALANLLDKVMELRRKREA